MMARLKVERIQKQLLNTIHRIPSSPPQYQRNALIYIHYEYRHASLGTLQDTLSTLEDFGEWTVGLVTSAAIWGNWNGLLRLD